MDDAKTDIPGPAPAPGPDAGTAPAVPATARSQRLAAALRDNLKRRKAAARVTASVKPSN